MNRMVLSGLQAISAKAVQKIVLAQDSNLKPMNYGSSASPQGRREPNVGPGPAQM